MTKKRKPKPKAMLALEISGTLYDRGETFGHQLTAGAVGEQFTALLTIQTRADSSLMPGGKDKEQGKAEMAQMLRKFVKKLAAHHGLNAEVYEKGEEQEP